MPMEYIPEHDNGRGPRDSESGRSLAGKTEFVFARIAAFGLTVHPQSRLALEAAVLRDAKGNWQTVLPNDSEFAIGLEALRDFTLFEFILEQWPFHENDRAARAKLRTALKDAVDPHKAARTTRGRDTQLELYVASAIHGARLPVEFRTPDVRTRIGGRFFDIEAKRPKSRESLISAVGHATRQIRDAGTVGAVFLDVSLAFNPTGDQFLRALPDDLLNAAYSKAINGCIHGIEAPLRAAIEGTPVASVYFQNHLLRQSQSGWRLASILIEYKNPSANPKLDSLSRVFYRSLERAWPR